MSRIVDEPYFTYSAYNALTSRIEVKCPKCHGVGVVTADDDNAAAIRRPVTGRSTATMSITSAKTVEDTTGWILKRRNGSIFLFFMWPAPIAEQSCREKFIKQRRLSPILLIFRMDENLILAWSCGF